MNSYVCAPTHVDIIARRGDQWPLCLQHTTVHCSTLQLIATHCNTLQHTATYCNMLQHAAPRCNTL